MVWKWWHERCFWKNPLEVTTNRIIIIKQRIFHTTQKHSRDPFSISKVDKKWLTKEEKRGHGSLFRTLLSWEREGSRQQVTILNLIQTPDTEKEAQNWIFWDVVARPHFCSRSEKRTCRGWCLETSQLDLTLAWERVERGGNGEKP